MFTLLIKGFRLKTILNIKISYRLHSKAEILTGLCCFALKCAVLNA